MPRVCSIKQSLDTERPTSDRTGNPGPDVIREEAPRACPPRPKQRDRRHVVHIVGTPDPGGIQNLILGLAMSPALSGYRSSVLCVFRAEGGLRARFDQAGIPVLACPFRWPNWLPIPYRVAQWIRIRLEKTFPWRLNFILRRMGADIVHTHITSRIHLQARGVLQRAKLPWVWTIHGLYNPQGHELREWRTAFRLARRRRARVTADSGGILKDLLLRGLKDCDFIRRVYAGADVSRFSRVLPRDPAWRTRWNIPKDAVVFGSSGRLVEEKAYDVFVRAAELLVRENANAHFAVAGTGLLFEELQGEIARRGLESRFHLLGFCEDVPALLAQFDVFVLSSRSEGFPLALIEALATGLPCVGTEVGGVPEMLGEETGVLVPAESPEDLAHAMRRLLSPEARQLAARGARDVARRFSYENCAGEFTEIYDGLLSGRPSGGS